MVWWDEREELGSCPAAVDQPSKHDGPCPQADAAASHLATPEAAVFSTPAASDCGTVVPPCGGEHRPLVATVDLDCEYVRKLVVDSLARRDRQWHVTVVEGQDDVVHPEALTSDFHWAEYERIDWDRVYSGEDTKAAKGEGIATYPSRWRGPMQNSLLSTTWLQSFSHTHCPCTMLRRAGIEQLLRAERAHPQSPLGTQFEEVGGKAQGLCPGSGDPRNAHFRGGRRRLHRRGAQRPSRGDHPRGLGVQV